MDFERRARTRTDLAAGDATFDFAGLTTTVVNLSGTGLLIELPADAPELPEVAEGAKLVLGGEPVPLEQVALRRTEEGEGGERRAAVKVLDEAARERLWAACDRYWHGTGQPEDHGPVDPVPEKGHYTEEARLKRLAWAERVSGVDLSAVGETTLDARQLTGNIENFVGSVTVPVGLAGPLLFHGEHARGPVIAPFATSEGTLVASASRGATAITRSGGVFTRVLHQRMNRAPTYTFRDLPTALRFTRWIRAHLADIHEQVGLVSRHARLVEVDPHVLGRVVHLRFNFETGDAAGQNMTTICTARACKWIADALRQHPEMQPIHFQIEGNASGDKKVNHLSVIGGRGTRVTAEAMIDRKTLQDVLKISPEQFQRAHSSGILGGIESGMVGYNINVANVVAAIFAATGQDIASVHESGLGVFTLEASEDGIYASMTMPTLIVGTVGGGTGLPQQRNWLELLGCAGPEKAPRLAEIICGFALALDLSTLAAVGGGQFADAHERLGRNRPINWFKTTDLVPDFFQPLVAAALDEPEVEVSEVVPLEVAMGSSIVAELTGREVKEKAAGLFPLRLHLERGGEAELVDVIAKVKPLDDEVILMTNKVASLCGGDLAQAYAKWRDWTGFKGTHTRELGIYASAPEPMRRVLPRVFGIHEDASREAYVVVLERLGEGIELKDTADDPGAWTTAAIDAALRGIADVHAVWLGREDELREQPWLGPVLDVEKVADMRELWQAMVEHNRTEYPGILDDFMAIRMANSVQEMPEWWAEMEAMPRTLVHNDFNPRNIAMRAEDMQLVAYDWELATLHVPQRDLAELLAFTLTEDADEATVVHHLEVHRQALEEASGIALDPARWRRGYRLALRDFVLTRVQMYLMAHTQRQYDFLERVVAVAKRLVEIESEHAFAQKAGGPEVSASDRKL